MSSLEKRLKVVRHELDCARLNAGLASNPTWAARWQQRRDDLERQAESLERQVEHQARLRRQHRLVVERQLALREALAG